MKNLGFSILECMIVIAIVTCSYLMAIPSLQRFVYLYHGKTMFDQLQQILHYARSLAIAQQRIIVLCPSTNGYSCAVSWQQGILVLGKNTNKYFKLNTYYGSLTLKQSGNTNNRIQILASGMLHGNGHFNYKAYKQHNWPEFNLYFNKALRTYLISS